MSQESDEDERKKELSPMIMNKKRHKFLSPQMPLKFVDPKISFSKSLRPDLFKIREEHCRP